jgi:hypothetical protein
MEGLAGDDFWGGRIFIGAEEWNTEKPWLDCRRKGDGEGKSMVAKEAGCACFECWPKEVGSDTRVSGLSTLDRFAGGAVEERADRK